jgi:hypothetical protein
VRLLGLLFLEARRDILLLYITVYLKALILRSLLLLKGYTQYTNGYSGEIFRQEVSARRQINVFIQHSYIWLFPVLEEKRAEVREALVYTYAYRLYVSLSKVYTRMCAYSELRSERL